jgi:hypothetical protein
VQHKRDYSTAAALVMARTLWWAAVKRGDLGLGRYAKGLQARATSAIGRGLRYLPVEKSLPPEMAPFCNIAPNSEAAHGLSLAPSGDASAKSVRAVLRSPTPAEQEMQSGLAILKGLRQVSEERRLSGAAASPSTTKSMRAPARSPTPSEMDTQTISALIRGAQELLEEQGLSGASSPPTRMATGYQKKFPTAVALAMARSMKRLAGKNADLDLARVAKKLHNDATASLRKRQSVLNVPPKKS